MACGLLVPQLAIEPGPSAVRLPSLNHWTPREFPILISSALRHPQLKDQAGVDLRRGFFPHAARHPGINPYFVINSCSQSFGFLCCRYIPHFEKQDEMTVVCKPVYASESLRPVTRQLLAPAIGQAESHNLT